MAIDHGRIDRFVAADQTRREVLAVLRAAGFSPAWVDETGQGSRWGFYLKPAMHLRNMLGTNREILIWVVQSREFQARTVSQAAETIARERPRLCEDFCIVLTHDPQTREHALEAGETYNTAFLGFSIRELVDRFKPQGSDDFLAEIRSRLYARDLYNIRSAVTRSDDFFGRESYSKQVANSLCRDHAHLGVFGLRKIGKTSLLNRLRTSIRGSNLAYFAHVDVEKIDAIQPTADYLLWSVGEAVVDSHRKLRQTPELLMFGRFKIFSRLPSGENVAELFNHDMRLLLADLQRPLVIALDEVERMASAEWGMSFVKFWRLLRGLDQENPGKLVFFVTGTNPRLFENQKVQDVDNPAWNYLPIEYLKPLDLRESSDLLVKVGRRMGLDWSADALGLIHRSTGGHPALLRAFGSLIHRSRASSSYAMSVDVALVRSLFDRFLLEESPLLSQLTAVLEDQYPDEAYLLGLLASGNVGEFRQLVEEFPQDAAHLAGYGLCDNPRTATALTNELLQTYLQRREAARGKGGGVPAVRTLDAVGPYELIRTRGRAGGFAQVFEGIRIGTERRVAVKVFQKGSLVSLEREIEPLMSVDHPAVVKISDYGQTDSGIVYLVMDLLEGDTLNQFCTRSSRAESEEAFNWTLQLLHGLRAVHPDQRKVEHLSRKPELSADESVEIIAARHGFVHRDIKPENVVLTQNGPVLIDFNISVRASSPVMTVSATPGYLPGDLVGSTWGPELDLFQLGLTMLQVVLGVDLGQVSADELRGRASEIDHPALRNLLTRLSSDDPEKRFSTAVDAIESCAG